MQVFGQHEKQTLAQLARVAGVGFDDRLSRGCRFAHQ